jgi:hypothetical protein
MASGWAVLCLIVAAVAASQVLWRGRSRTQARAEAASATPGTLPPPASLLHAAAASWLQACCAVAEGAAVPPRAASTPLAVLLHDWRLAQMGGRDGLPRSLGSVLSCYVARFLGYTGEFRGVVSGILAVNRKTWIVDSAVALVGDRAGHRARRALQLHLSDDGFTWNALLRNEPDGRLHVCRAPDGVIVVARGGYSGVEVFTADMTPVRRLNKRTTYAVAGLCASTDRVAIVEADPDRDLNSLSVLRRQDGALVAKFAMRRRYWPSDRAPCFLSCGSEVAVVDIRKFRVVVFDLTGRQVFTIRDTVATATADLPPQTPVAVDSSAAGELVVVSLTHIFVFSARRTRSHATFGEAAMRFDTRQIAADLALQQTLGHHVVRVTVHGTALVLHVVVPTNAESLVLHVAVQTNAEYLVFVS